MLNQICNICDGDGEIALKDKNDCILEWRVCPMCENGIRPGDPDEKVYVNVYYVTREYGGPEEGGWWFNQLNCVECVPCKNKYSEEIAEDLEKEYAKSKYGNIYSVLGGRDVQVAIERRPNQSETRERPRYE